MIDPLVEREYNLRARHPERAAVYERFQAASVALRARRKDWRVLQPAPGERRGVDFFPAPSAAGRAPLFVFVHGGYWRALERAIFSFLAEPWLRRGVHVALPGYELAPTAPVRAIGAQVRAALEHVLQQADALGIDRARVLVGGHSAGAQLGAWALGEMDRGTACAFLGISGVYDLEPLLDTSVNLDVRLDRDEARALSPMHRPVDPALRVLCAAGGAETAGFRCQSRDYAEHARAHGAAATAIEVPGRTHFDVLDALADPHDDLFRRAAALLDLPTGAVP